MHRIELNRDAKVLDGFFQTPALLQQLVPKAVPPQKSLGILGHHLPERLKIHPALYQLSSLRKRWHFRKRFPTRFLPYPLTGHAWAQSGLRRRSGGPTETLPERKAETGYPFDG